FELHAVGQLERLNAGFELRVITTGALVLSVELSEQVELPTLSATSYLAVDDILDQVLRFGFFGVDMSYLVHAGKKCRAPIGNIGDGQSWTHGNKSGQVEIFCSQAIRNPGTVTRS